MFTSSAGNAAAEGVKLALGLAPAPTKVPIARERGPGEGGLALVDGARAYVSRLYAKPASVAAQRMEAYGATPGQSTTGAIMTNARSDKRVAQRRARSEQQQELIRGGGREQRVQAREFVVPGSEEAWVRTEARGGGGDLPASKRWFVPTDGSPYPIPAEALYQMERAAARRVPPVLPAMDGD